MYGDTNKQNTTLNETSPLHDALINTNGTSRWEWEAINL